MKRILPLLILGICLTACVPAYTLVPEGKTTSNGYEVVLESEWNKAPEMLKPGPRTEMWTKDGVELNQLLFVSQLDAGESLFHSRSRELPMPKFAADMLPNDVIDFVKTSFKNLYGGEISIQAGHLRPQSFGQTPGYRFQLDFFTPSGLAKRGDVLATIKNDQLYLMVFVAARMHYYDRDQPEIEKLFSTVTF